MHGFANAMELLCETPKCSIKEASECVADFKYYMEYKEEMDDDEENKEPGVDVCR